MCLDTQEGILQSFAASFIHRVDETFSHSEVWDERSGLAGVILQVLPLAQCILLPRRVKIVALADWEGNQPTSYFMFRLPSTHLSLGQFFFFFLISVTVSSTHPSAVTPSALLRLFNVT